jgi:hypothetical protein
MLSLHPLRGRNFWSRFPVVRMDVTVGAFDEINSADVPGVPEALAGALPGLAEHRCSIGERGGFLLRLRRGTYVPHITEHVALALQDLAGHDVGFGQTRGGDADGEYTLVFEHRHEVVGLRAAALALEVVQRAFAGTLDPTPASVAPMVAELCALAATPDVPPLAQRVLCGITGGQGTERAATRDLIARGAAECVDGALEPPWAGPVRADDLVVDVAPSYLLAQGLPYARSMIAVILDAAPTDVPAKYQEEDRARKLVTVLADGVQRDGVVVVPAREWELQDYARDRGCRVAVFGDEPVGRRDARVARAMAWPADGRIVLDTHGQRADGGPLADDQPTAPQVAAALAAFTLRELGRDAGARARGPTRAHDQRAEDHP